MEIIIPLLAACVIVFALIKGVNPYEAFAEGASEALPVLIKVLPFLATMLICISVFRGSGAMALLIHLFAPLFKLFGIPEELTPLVVLRPFSGSASLALLQDTLLTYGADSHIGRAASVSLGSTETIFYTLALYFGAVGITKTRHSVPVALISGFIGILCSVWLTTIM